MSDFGKYHHLMRCSTVNGVFSILAIDHRANLVAEMEKARGRTVTDSEVIAFKGAVIRQLAGSASGVLTDPEMGFPAFAEAGPRGIGLLAPLEVTDYTLHPSHRTTEFIDGWGVDKIKLAGGDGVKLLLYYHPEAENARAQTDVVDRIVEQCAAHAIPFFLEPISYSLDPSQPLLSHERAQIVIETARHFSARGVDVLKVEFPHDAAQVDDEFTWAEALKALDDACKVPWALLSAGVTFDVFLRQTIAACSAGASGVMVGRAVWAEATALEGEKLDVFLQTTALNRMRALASVCELYGMPWNDRYAAPDFASGWYKS